MRISENKLQDQLVEIEKIRKKISIYKNIDADAGYIKTNHKINHHLRKQSILKTFNRIAAILLLPLLISTLLLLYYITASEKNETIPVLYTEIKAVPGTIIRTELPDKSIVWLNSNSSLRYPNQFSGDKRKVELIGEGFFEVQTDPDFPFEVNTPSGLQITARGTAFNVYAYEDEPKSEVVLQDGAVDVKYKNEYLTMKPDEMIILHKTNSNHWIKKTNANIEEKIAWKYGRLIFRNIPLDEVTRKLSRRYNVDITLHNKKNENYGIRATFTNETITQILDYLKMSVSIEWSLSEVEQNTDATYTKQHIDIKIK